jgi:hypothetical protein
MPRYVRTVRRGTRAPAPFNVAGERVITEHDGDRLHIVEVTRDRTVRLLRSRGYRLEELDVAAKPVAESVSADVVRSMSELRAAASDGTLEDEPGRSPRSCACCRGRLMRIGICRTAEQVDQVLVRRCALVAADKGMKLGLTPIASYDALTAQAFTDAGVLVLVGPESDEMVKAGAVSLMKRVLVVLPKKPAKTGALVDLRRRLGDRLVVAVRPTKRGAPYALDLHPGGVIERVEGEGLERAWQRRDRPAKRPRPGAKG